MNYKIIEPKTVYTIRLESGTSLLKCGFCKNKLIYKGEPRCVLPMCYKEFYSEEGAREWLDKVNEFEKSIDEGLLIAAGEKPPLNCETCKGCDCLDCPEGD